MHTDAQSLPLLFTQIITSNVVFWLIRSMQFIFNREIQPKCVSHAIKIFLHLTQSDSRLPADRRPPAWSGTAPSGATFSASKTANKVLKCGGSGEQIAKIKTQRLAAGKSKNIKKSKTKQHITCLPLRFVSFILCVWLRWVCYAVRVKLAGGQS